ncbi:MAG: helix-turn-helix transcriptional regulator [Candidatus Sericytochromatia bacterium]|nr:helix-turn-helix transcriptional regulator [Candidatus Sericytochromatia bacterium]
MSPWSRNGVDTFGMIYAGLEIENQVDLSKVILARWEREFLERLINETADPDTGKKPISQDRIAEIAGVSQKTISNLLNPSKDPRWSSVQKVGESFGIHFVADYSFSINNEAVLAEVIKRLQR